MEVLNERRKAPGAAPRVGTLHQPAQHGEDLALLDLRVHARHRPVRIRHSEEFEQDRKDLAEALVQQQHAPGDLLAHRAIVVLLGDPEVAAKHLQHRQVGNVLPVRHRVADVHRYAAGPAAFGELEAEPALPRPGLRHHADDLAVTGLRLLQCRFQRRHVGVAADEARQAAAARHIKTRARGADADQAMNRHGCAHSLHLEVAQIFQLEVPLHERCRRAGQVAGIGRGQRLHALRQTDGVALRRVVHAQVVTDLADDHLAGVNADARRKADAVRPFDLGGVARELDAQMQRRVAGALRVVLVRDRRAEQRHDAVAGVLVHRPLEAVHALGEDGEEAVEDRVPLFGIELLGQLHRALDVGEQYGDLLALAFEGTATAENLFRQMAGRIGAGTVDSRLSTVDSPIGEMPGGVGKGVRGYGGGG